MPKKEKKIRTKKLKIKNKNLINVKINIDNSKKSTTRRTQQPKQQNINTQPFVNFPSHQPARIQILENKSNSFSSPDLSKTMDEYQKQFRTYLETSDQNIKNMIEKYDDTLKKNIAPQQKQEPETKPGSSNVYADTEGNVVYQQPIKKNVAYQTPIAKIDTSTINEVPNKKLDSNITNQQHTRKLDQSYFDRWNKPNELKVNQMSNLTTIPMPINQIFEPIQKAEVKPVEEIVEAVEEIVEAEVDPNEQIFEAKTLDLDFLNEEKKQKDILENKVNAYKEYKKLWDKEMPDKKFTDIFDDKITTSSWKNKIRGLSTKNQRDKDDEELRIKKLNEKDEKNIQKKKEADEIEKQKQKVKQDKINIFNELSILNQQKKDNKNQKKEEKDKEKEEKEPNFYYNKYVESYKEFYKNNKLMKHEYIKDPSSKTPANWARMEQSINFKIRDLNIINENNKKNT
jgi:hypothetical protein